MNQRLTNISTAALFEELTTRVLQLHDDAERPGSAGSMRTLLTEAYEAGRCAGIGVQLDATSTALRHLLDEATARMPDVQPPGIDGDDPALRYWREGRQHLFQLVGAQCEATKAAGSVHANEAARRAAKLQQRASAALAPALPLRARAGRWLLELGERISSRGAA